MVTASDASGEDGEHVVEPAAVCSSGVLAAVT